MEVVSRSTQVISNLEGKVVSQCPSDRYRQHRFCNEWQST